MNVRPVSPHPVLPAISSSDEGGRVGDAVVDEVDRGMGEMPAAGDGAQGGDDAVEGADAEAVLRKALPSHICLRSQRSDSTRPTTCRIEAGATSALRHSPVSGRICIEIIRVSGRFQLCTWTTRV